MNYSNIESTLSTQSADSWCNCIMKKFLLFVILCLIAGLIFPYHIFLVVDMHDMHYMHWANGIIIVDILFTTLGIIMNMYTCMLFSDKNTINMKSLLTFTVFNVTLEMIHGIFFLIIMGGYSTTNYANKIRSIPLMMMDALYIIIHITAIMMMSAINISRYNGYKSIYVKNLLQQLFPNMTQSV